MKNKCHENLVRQKLSDFTLKIKLRSVTTNVKRHLE